MANSTWHFYFPLLISLILLCLTCDNVNSQIEAKPWYETLPAVAMDYKVHIDAGKEDCYYQYVQAGATFYVSFQVIQGGDLNIGFVVRDVNLENLSPYFYNNSGTYERKSDLNEYYAMCIDNTNTRFGKKLVNIAAVVIKYDQWEVFAADFETMNMTATNMTLSLSNIEKQIKYMSMFQMYSKHKESMDIALLNLNHAYVQNRSIIQIALIMLTSSLQVYFVRKLFNSRHNKSMKTSI